jgi:hypothetical protein
LSSLSVVDTKRVLSLVWDNYTMVATRFFPWRSRR